MRPEQAAAHLNTARSLAHQLRVRTDSADFDDLVQEGAVAALLATEIDRSDPITYGMVAARRRILGTLTGKHPMYGSEAEPGRRIHDQFRDQQKRELDADSVISVIEWRRDAYAEVDRRVDVQRATSGLPETDLLIAGMIGRGYDWASISVAVGTSRNAVYKHWHRNIRPALRERLRGEVNAA